MDELAAELELTVDQLRHVASGRASGSKDRPLPRLPMKSLADRSELLYAVFRVLTEGPKTDAQLATALTDDLDPNRPISSSTARRWRVAAVARHGNPSRFYGRRDA